MRMGIDLGGTKLEGAVLDGSGRILARTRVATPRGDYEATLQALSGLVTALERDAGERCSVGIAIPGTISSSTRLVKNANSTWLIGRPLDGDLAALLERPLRFANDANCFALSEAIDGAARGARVVFGVIVGTGTGGGVIVDGRVLAGVNGIAGEWGHNPLPWPAPDEWPGPPCYCGRTGCIETFLSGPGLTRTYESLTGLGLDASRIAALAASGDPGASTVLDQYEDRMARGLASVINVLDPDVIVLGGGLSNIDRLYARVPGLLRRWVFSDEVRTKIRRAAHGDSSGVRGAAWLW